MANANRPMGLSPVKTITGAPYNGQARVYAILAADTNGYAIGDPVASVAGGGDASGNAAITIGVAGAAIRGVIVGLADRKDAFVKVGNLDSIVRPAAAQSTDWYALVVDDPTVIFEIQEVNSGTPLAAADIGLNANFVAGANNGFYSGFTLDNATELGTATLNLKILELVQRADNEIGAAAKWLVKINNHEFNTGTAGV